MMVDKCEFPSTYMAYLDGFNCAGRKNNPHPAGSIERLRFDQGASDAVTAQNNSYENFEFSTRSMLAGERP